MVKIQVFSNEPGTKEVYKTYNNVNLPTNHFCWEDVVISYKNAIFGYMQWVSCYFLMKSV